jgi:hypothetical protein
MIFKIRKTIRIGNSYGITIPKEIMRACGDSKKEMYVCFLEGYEKEKIKVQLNEQFNGTTNGR